MTRQPFSIATALMRLGALAAFGQDGQPLYQTMYGEQFAPT
ncbi:MAG: hypothetical protein ACREXK_14040 [Gammaproteobacteria bacterium]